MKNFQIELTNHCQLQCEECPNIQMQRKREFMSTAVFDAILNQYIIPDKPDTVILHKDGESLLNINIRYFMRAIDYVITTKFDIYTNGLLLTEDFVEFLSTLKNNVRILISFHFHGAGGKKVDYTNVSHVIERCMAKQYKNVEFVLVTHKIDSISMEELTVWEDKWKPALAQYDKFTGLHVNPHINPWAERIKQSNIVSFNGSCPYADFGHLFFGVTGNIIPCCMDLEEEIVFGNVLTDNKETMMDKVHHFYKQLENKKVEDKLCQKCLK